MFKMSITPVVGDTIYRRGAFAVRTALGAMNVGGFVAEIAKLVANCGNAKQGGDSTSVEHGSANESGEAAGMTIEKVGNTDRPANTAGRLHQIASTMCGCTL